MRALHKVFHGDRLERNRTIPFAQPFHSLLKSRERSSEDSVLSIRPLRGPSLRAPPHPGKDLRGQLELPHDFSATYPAGTTTILYWSLLIGSICSRLEALHHDALVFRYLETQRKACSTLSNSPIENRRGCQSPSRFWGPAPPTSTLLPYCLTVGHASFRYS
jgi:hypothetical protein